jgi:chromosomal replication initiator protein
MSDGDKTEQILIDVSSFYGLTPRRLRGPERQRHVAAARAVAMYLVRKATFLSYPEIGSRFGSRDHSTVIAAVRKVERWRRNDLKIDADVTGFEASLGLLGGGQPPEKDLDSPPEEDLDSPAQ